MASTRETTRRRARPTRRLRAWRGDSTRRGNGLARALHLRDRVLRRRVLPRRVLRRRVLRRRVLRLRVLRRRVLRLLVPRRRVLRLRVLVMFAHVPMGRR